ncbi:MAG TPA: PA2779 family protein [Gammaproteobacteria bacterium]
MECIRTFCRRITPFLLAAFGLMSLHIPAAQAGMIAPSAYAQQTAADPHQQLRDFLSRDEIRAELVKLGVDPDVAKTRVQALSDQEAAVAAERMSQLPAGGDGVVGAIVFIFLVLLITDLLGLTDVFPFVKSR